MFFFIGGIQPKTVDIDKKSSICFSCGFQQVRLKRIDQYISIFFLPVLRIKKGEPFLMCDRCGSISSDETGKDFFHIPKEDIPIRCRYCGKNINPDFHFCPFCGKSL